MNPVFDFEKELTPKKIAKIINRVNELPKPKLILILSGKRKSGKDFIENLLLDKFSNKILSFRISGPIKKEFARQFELDYEQLLSDSSYKENYRRMMVHWSEKVRKHDAHYFLRLSILDAFEERKKKMGARFDCPIWLLNDARRPTDLHYFLADSSEVNLDNCQIITIRVVANNQVRSSRGWTYKAGIDDQTTECGLDNYDDWNYKIYNDTTPENALKQLSPVLEAIKTKI